MKIVFIVLNRMNVLYVFKIIKYLTINVSVALLKVFI